MVELITILEDDPAIGTLTQVPKPDVEKQPFGYSFSATELPPSDDPNTDAFRYWTAAEALRRGADFWAPAISPKRWQRGAILEVNFDEIQILQANYDRLALNFFYGPTPNGIVYAGASPDLLCHELGHAILDAIKPDLWHTGLHEIAAFHESFGDISAILCALQLTSFRASILKETGGQIYSNNRLSRVAEQFGKALHQVDPGAADADCLRNAVNSFSYRDPLSLNPTDASLQVASAPHSFSRIMTGALFEAFAAMLKVHAKDPDDPKPDELLEISVHMRDIMANGVKRSAVRPNYYAEVAACITRESAAKPQYDPEYQSLFAAAFLRRNILSHETVAEITFGGIAQPVDAAPASLSAAAVRNRKRRVRPPQTALLAIPAAKYGLGEPLHVETSSHLPSFIARSAMTNGRSMELLSPDTAAMAFVDELFANSKVDFKGQKINKPAVQRKYRSRTHQIVRGPQGLHLERVMFSCGHCNDLLGW